MSDEFPPHVFKGHVRRSLIETHGMAKAILITSGRLHKMARDCSLEDYVSSMALERNWLGTDVTVTYRKAVAA